MARLMSSCDMKDYHDDYGCMGHITCEELKPYTTREGYMGFATDSEYKEYFETWCDDAHDE